MLSHIKQVLEAQKVFERKRKNMDSRALGILLYHCGLSLRMCKIVVSSFEPVYHEAIRKWYHKADTMFSVDKTNREIIAVDETKIKINGQLYILWAAIDIQSWEILGVWVSKGRASLEAYSFLKYVLRRCLNQPKILVDGGPWYKPALGRLKIKWEHVTFGLRNPVEQWFGILKHRIKRFYRDWLYNAELSTIQEWLDCFVAMYHVTRC